MWNSVGVAGLDVETQRHDGYAVLVLHGELEMATRSILSDAGQAQLAVPGLIGLTLNLADLTFLDSSGVGALVHLRNQATDRGVTMDLADVPTGPARVLTIGGLAETFGLPAPDSPTDTAS